jgi:CHRD domain-containing protein
MPTLRPIGKWHLLGVLGMVALIAGGCASGMSTTHGMPITRLTGGQEVPPVGGTAAHIHRGKAGSNGPVILPLTKTGENSFAVPDRAFVSDSDFGAYNDNELYVNVHSANNPNGEVRGQLRPTP